MALQGVLMQRLEHGVTRAWYRGAWWLWLLWPLSLVVSWVVVRRRRRFLNDPPAALVKPVVVVGGITVGGSGKTPIILALIQALREKGKTVAVVSRGYGRTASDGPLFVTSDLSAALAGDEPLLIARMTGVPVVVDSDRRRAVEVLLAKHPVDMVLSDDGLQHYSMPRSFEVVVLDADRGLGNGRLLPMGPLREPRSRLRTVDWVLERNGDNPDTRFIYEPACLRHHNTGAALGVAEAAIAWQGRAIAAVTALGQPEQFFGQLTSLGFIPTTRALGDHQMIGSQDLADLDAQVVIVTDKDAVKLAYDSDERIWVLEINAKIPAPLVDSIVSLIEAEA